MPTKSRTFSPVVIPFTLSDEATNRFINEIESQLNTGVELIVICCSELVRVTSANVGMLMLAYKNCSVKNVPVRLVSVSESFKRVMDLLDLTDLFIIDDTVNENSTGEIKLGSQATQYKNLSLEVIVDSKNIDKATNRVISFMRSNDVPKDIIFQIQVIFYEIATNIRCHSGLGNKDKFNFNIDIYGNSIMLTFRDRGVPFDITSNINTDGVLQLAKAGRTRGYGITIIERSSDMMEYKRIDNTINEITIKKYWE